MYIDIEYIRERIREDDLLGLSTDKGEADGINEARITAIINDAEGEVNTALLQGGFAVPVINPDAFLQRITFDIFRYHLYGRKYDDEEMKDTYVRYNKAYQKINAIAKGEMQLPYPRAIVPLSKVLVTSRASCERIFTKERLRRLK